jgi:3-oxoacyl-[acyl-carrier-protein] synthase-1
MINVAGTNIISSLGFTTDENFAAVKRGISGVRQYDAGTFGLPEAFAASLIDRERLNCEFSSCSVALRCTAPATTELEKAAILSAFTAGREANVDLSDERILFILSTTKGNVDLLGNIRRGRLDPQSPVFLWHTAKVISHFFGNPNAPVIVSNACVSGAAAQIAAMRELENGNYDYAAVVGVDFLSKFIVSGFQSFKALSREQCKPFDRERCGLNLGEAAATVIFSRATASHRGISLLCGAIRNDASHISGPSRTGEGSYSALQYVLPNVDKEQIAFINAHGTATPYNDAMEAVAIARADLADVPVNSLKPFFGHTLGAAGVLESIISMKAFNENLVLKSLNYNEQCFDSKINVSKENHFSDRRCFIKMLSGFGGVNATLLFGKTSASPPEENSRHIRCRANLYIKKYIRLSFKNSEEITGYYRILKIDYPKFFKMDNLSKLGLVASETVLRGDSRFRDNAGEGSEDIAVVCFNRSSSLDIDTQYQSTIADSDNYFPSPSLFVYTLPNIVAGETAIRYKLSGETSFYINEKFDAGQIMQTVANTFSDKNTGLALVAWVESFEDVHEILMFLVERNGDEKMVLTEKTITELYGNGGKNSGHNT